MIMASASKAAKTIDFVLEEFSAAAGWDVHGEKYNTAGSENDDSSREEEILFDGTEEEWYSDEEEGWIQSKDDIAKNDWLDDEEADRLLNLYAKKDVREI